MARAGMDLGLRPRGRRRSPDPRRPVHRPGVRSAASAGATAPTATRFEFAARVGAKEVVLFHHDPSHDDAMLERLLADALRRVKPAFRVSCGCEGAVFEVGSNGAAPPRTRNRASFGSLAEPRRPCAPAAEPASASHGAACLLPYGQAARRPSRGLTGRAAWARQWMTRNALRRSRDLSERARALSGAGDGATRASCSAPRGSRQQPHRGSHPRARRRRQGARRPIRAVGTIAPSRSPSCCRSPNDSAADRAARSDWNSFDYFKCCRWLRSATSCWRWPAR